MQNRAAASDFYRKHHKKSFIINHPLLTTILFTAAYIIAGLLTQ